MPPGMEVGLRPGHIELDGDSAPPPQKDTASQFSARVYCGQRIGTFFLLVLLPVIITVHLKANLKLTCLPPS